jgi:hypothetical protein
MCNNNAELFCLKQIVRSIKELDKFRHSKVYLGSDENVTRIDEARKNLINILFDNGYEIDYKTKKLIVSKVKRNLL